MLKGLVEQIETLKTINTRLHTIKEFQTLSDTM